MMQLDARMQLQVSGPNAVTYLADSAFHILPWSHLFKMGRILAGGIVAKVISMTSLLGPVSMSQKESNTMRPYRTSGVVTSRSDRELPVTVGVTGRLPRPAFVGAANINLRPVAILNGLGNRPLHVLNHSTSWYE